MDCFTTRLLMEIGIFFLSLTLKNARKLGKLVKFFLVDDDPKKHLRENDFKRSSEIQKFSRENVDFFWWSANQVKICQVVRESEKVETRCPSAYNVHTASSSFHSFLFLFRPALPLFLVPLPPPSSSPPYLPIPSLLLPPFYFLLLISSSPPCPLPLSFSSSYSSSFSYSFFCSSNSVLPFFLLLFFIFLPALSLLLSLPSLSLLLLLFFYFILLFSFLLLLF